MGLFSSKKSSSSTTISDVKEQNVGVEGDVGVLVSPEGAIAGGGGGTVQASPYSHVTQTISTEGLGGEEVQGLLDSILVDQAGTRESLSELAGDVTAGLRESQKQLGESLAATRAPEATQLAQLMPLALVLVLLVALGSFGRK
jgi:hypothetical protein